MLKPKKIIKVASLHNQCGDCIHYKGIALYTDVCNALGIQKYAIAPTCFVPDTQRLIRSLGIHFAENLADLLEPLEDQSLRLLASVIDQASEVRKFGFQWGQPVYFTLGYDYITHYFKGYVIGIRDDNIIVAATLRKSKNCTHCLFPSSSLLTKTQWSTHSLNLLKENKISLTDRRSIKYKNPIPELLEADGTLDWDFDELRAKILEGLYDPPSIDNTSDELLNRQKKKTEAKLAEAPKKIVLVKAETEFSDDVEL